MIIYNNFTATIKNIYPERSPHHVVPDKDKVVTVTQNNEEHCFPL